VPANQGWTLARHTRLDDARRRTPATSTATGSSHAPRAPRMAQAEGAEPDPLPATGHPGPRPRSKEA